MTKRAISVWTPANIVTVVRIATMPVWLIIAEIARAQGALNCSSVIAWVSFVLYVLIAETDKLDGYLARSRNEITTFGKFLDPIADKLCVTCTLLYLLELGLVPIFAVVIILAREFIVSGLRMVVASEGVVVAASNLGKWKTAITMIAIGGYLFYLALPAGGFANVMYLITRVLMAAAVVLTAWSGVDYLMKLWPAISEQEV